MKDNPVSYRQADKQSGRIANYDLIRVIACLFVIFLHIKNKPFSGVAVKACTTVLFTSNYFFFMLSGRFNLIKEFHAAEDYKEYYRSKFVSILFPYVMVSFLLSIWRMYLETDTFSVRRICGYFYREIMETNAGRALWFMYPFIGILLSVPFLSKMLHAMSEKELHILIAIAILWNIVRVYLTVDIGVSFSYSAWILGDWTFAFVLGYYCHQTLKKQNRKWLYILGIIGYAVTVSGRYFLGDAFAYSTDFSVAFTLFSASLYVFLENEIVIRGRWIRKILSFVAKHTFIIYMLHAMVMHFIMPHFVTVKTGWRGLWSRFAVIFLFSFLGAVILQSIIIRPGQYLLNKLFKYCDNRQLSPK